MSDDNTEHAHLSPSGSKKWMSCPGSLVLEREFPDQPNTYSDDGTAMHTIAARMLTTHKGVPAMSFVDELVPVHYKTELPRYVLFTYDMADLVQGYVDSLLAIAGGEPIMVEQRVDFSEFVGVPNQFGTLDAGIAFLMDGELFVGDLKTGFTPVAVENNSQLMLYALGLLRKLLDNDLGTHHTDPFDYARALDLYRIRLAIYQPKVNTGWVEWTCSLKDLVAFATLARSKALSTINAERDHGVVPTDEWRTTYLNQQPNAQDCAFCKAMATCPSMRNKVETVIGADFSVVVEQGLKPAGPQLDSGPLAEAMAAAALVEDYFKSVRAEVERRLLLDLPVPGWGLELGRKGARKFKDEAAVEKMMRFDWRLTYEDVYDMKLKSPTALEKLTKAKEGEKPIIGPKRWEKLTTMVEQAAPKPSVKPLTQIKKPYKADSPSSDDFSTVKE